MKKIEAVVIIKLFLMVVSCSAQVTVSWDVNKTDEFKNGDTMELICTVTGTCCSSTRRWNGGLSFSSLVTNGISVNSTKYNETIHSNSFSLLIYKMERSDFLYKYRCTYEFTDSTTGLLSPPINARYVPASSEIQTLSSSTDGDKLSFEVNVTTVFPEPSCTATFGNANLTSNMTVTSADNFPFKFAVISMANVAYSCPGSLDVSCSVGSYSFDVLKLEPCLISATPSSEATSEMESSFLEVTGIIYISNVLPSFESTDYTFEPRTSLNAKTLSLEDNLSRISPFSLIGSLEPTELLNNEYKTTEIEVDSTLFSLRTLNFTDETIKSRLFNSAMSTSMVTSSRNNLPISSASVLYITTDISLHVDLKQSRDVRILTSEIIQKTQTRFTSLFSSVLLHTKPSNMHDKFPSTLSASFDVQSSDTLSSQLSLDSFIISFVSKDKSCADILSLSIKTSPVSPVLPVHTSSNSQIYTSGDPWSVSKTEFVLVNTPAVDSFTSYEYSSSVFQIISRIEGTSKVQVLPIDTTSNGQNSFPPVEGFSISLFPYSSSLSQGQPVDTSFSQTLLLFDLSSISQKVRSTDLSVNKIVPSETSSMNPFTSLADTLTFQYTEWSANESISSMVYQSLHLSSLDQSVAISSETFNDNSEFSYFSGTSLFHQPELTTTPLVNHLILTEVTTTPSINHPTQSDLLSETFTLVNRHVSQSSHISEVSSFPSADIFSKSKNVLTVDILTLQQTGQTLFVSTYSSIKYINSLTTEHPFNTPFISTVIPVTSTPLVTSVQMNIDTTSLRQFPKETSSVSIKVSTVLRSTAFDDSSLLSPSSSLKFHSFEEFSSFSEMMSTNINHVVTSYNNAIQSSDTINVFSSPPSSNPTQTPDLSFREAQIIIMSCSITAVMLVVFVPLMVLYYLGKLQRTTILKENKDKSENDDLSCVRHPHVFNRNIINNYQNMGKNLAVRFHNRSFSDSSLYTCDFEYNWNNLTC